LNTRDHQHGGPAPLRSSATTRPSTTGSPRASTLPTAFFSKNPLLAAERCAKRETLLKATEIELRKIADAVARTKRPLRGADKIGLRLGRVVNRYKMAKHFETEITEDSFSFSRKEPEIAAEAGLDGIYVLARAFLRGTTKRGGCLVLQVPRRSRAGLSRPQHRPRHPPDPPPQRGAGRSARVPADIVLLRHLPHGAGTLADALPR